MVGPHWDKETTKLVIGWFGSNFSFNSFFKRCSGNKCIIDGFLGGFMWWSLGSNPDWLVKHNFDWSNAMWHIDICHLSFAMWDLDIDHQYYAMWHIDICHLSFAMWHLDINHPSFATWHLYINHPSSATWHLNIDHPS